MQIDASHSWIVDLSLVDKTCDQVNGTYLPDQAGIERDLAETLENLLVAFRNMGAPVFRQLDHQNVFGGTFVD